jgi:hypothetical protein
MRPPSVSACDESALCCAPPFTWLASWYGYWQPALRGSGRHTLNCPSLVGIPSAPGKVPKYESNERFSCMITTTCRIRWIPWCRPARSGAGRTTPAFEAMPDPPQPASTSSETTTATRPGRMA